MDRARRRRRRRVSASTRLCGSDLVPQVFETGVLATGQVQGSAGALFTATADATYVKQFAIGYESAPSVVAAVVTIWLKEASHPARFYRRIELEEGQSAD